MSKSRVTAESLFGDILGNVNFVDCKRKLKFELSYIGKINKFSPLFNNAHTLLCRNNVSSYYDIEPPVLEDYSQ